MRKLLVQGLFIMLCVSLVFLIFDLPNSENISSLVKFIIYPFLALIFIASLFYLMRFFKPKEKLPYVLIESKENKEEWQKISSKTFVGKLKGFKTKLSAKKD